MTKRCQINPVISWQIFFAEIQDDNDEIDSGWFHDNPGYYYAATPVPQCPTNPDMTCQWPLKRWPSVFDLTPRIFNYLATFDPDDMWMVRSGKTHQLRPIAKVASKLIEIIIGIQPDQGISYSNVMIQVSLITKEWPKLVSWVKKSKDFTFKVETYPPSSLRFTIYLNKAKLSLEENPPILDLSLSRPWSRTCCTT